MQYKMAAEAFVLRVKIYKPCCGRFVCTSKRYFNTNQCFFCEHNLYLCTVTSDDGVFVYKVQHEVEVFGYEDELFFPHKNFIFPYLVNSGAVRIQVNSAAYFIRAPFSLMFKFKVLLLLTLSYCAAELIIREISCFTKQCDRLEVTFLKKQGRRFVVKSLGNKRKMF